LIAAYVVPESNRAAIINERLLSSTAAKRDAQRLAAEATPRRDGGIMGAVAWLDPMLAAPTHGLYWRRRGIG
jgi:hypothetical protein